MAVALLGRSIQAWSRDRTCDDGGPWRCTHSGCVSGTVSCFDLRFACTSLLASLVDPTPSLGTDTVLAHCPATCDPRCSAAQAAPAETDFVVRFAKSRGARAACRYWHHVGCITNVVAKMCDGHVDWTALLQDDDGVWSCCCPTPRPCAARERSPTCTEALDDHLGPLLPGLPALRLPPIAALLAARADLYMDGGHLCRQVLAGVVAEEGERGVADAPVACGDELQLNRTIARQELHCEHLVWAWEALGQGKGEEFERSGCPFNPANRGGRDAPGPKREL